MPIKLMSKYETYSLDQLLVLVRNGRADVSKKAADEIRERMRAAEQKMYPTLGESAASDSESKPAPKRVI